MVRDGASFLGGPVADSGYAEDDEGVPESKEEWHIIEMDLQSLRFILHDGTREACVMYVPWHPYRNRNQCTS